jgi:UDP-GlcNAc:undecaprenyl-phosphate GlcNAc-1-phosphate transferase
MSFSAGQFALLGLMAFALTGLLTWPVRLLAIRIGAMDKPNLERKTQKEPVPYLGGASIAIAVTVLAYAGVVASDFTTTNFPLASYVLIPALVMGAMGLIDDLRGLPALPRLFVQTAIAIAVSLVLINTNTVGVAFDDSIINRGLTIFWIVGICNSINFFDNLDGGAAGTVAVVTLGIFYIAYNQGQESVSALAITTAGATLGFLIWNKQPAKIYMGDAGALFLGVVISVLTIRVNPGIQPSWKSLALIPILLAVPILDTTVAVTSRIYRRLSPLTGGKDHLSHRLVRKGLTQKTAAIALWAGSALFALLAIGIYDSPTSLGTPLTYLAAAIWASALIYFLRIPSED